MKEKDDPIRLEKNNETIQQGLGHMVSQIEELKKKKTDHEKERTKWENQLKDCQKSIE